MPGILSKIQGWIYSIRHFFLKLLNRLQSFVLRNQKSDQKAVKLFWVEDRRIKICEEIFAIDLEILAYIQRSHPSSFDEKLQKLMKEKTDLVASWRNPTLPENLEDLPADAGRRRQLCVQRAERCKQLYDDLAGYKTLYNETIEEAGVVLTYDEKIHLTKPYSLFDPTCTCCFLEIKFHFPALAPPKIRSKYVGEDVTNEAAPLLENEFGNDFEDTYEVHRNEDNIEAHCNELEETAEVDGIESREICDVFDNQKIPTDPEQIPAEMNGSELEKTAEEFDLEQTTEFFSPLSKTSNDTFKSCKSFGSECDMHTVRTGSISTQDKESNDAVDGDSSNGTLNAEDADENQSSSSSSASEGSVHMGEDSSDEEAMINKSDEDEDDEFVGQRRSEDDVTNESKENDFDNEKKELLDSTNLHQTSNSSFRE